MKAQSTAKPEQSRHQDSRDRGGQGQGQQAIAVLDSRPEMAQQQGLLSLMAGSPRLQRKCACGAPSAAGGNCAACEVKANGAGSQVLQKQLAIGAADDPLEREADRVADQVMAAPAHSAVSGAPLRIQRFQNQGGGQMDKAPASVERVLAGSGRPLEPGLRRDMEQRFGHDFSRVRLHTDGEAGRSAQDVNASAYTVGDNIVFGAGRFIPGTHEGRRLIAHELTHVLQQSSSSGTLVQRSLAGCQDLLRNPSAISLVSGQLVHRLIGSHFMSTVDGARSVAIPGASAAPQRSQAICGGDDQLINPQVIGGMSGAGLPDLARLTPNGILQVAEIKPAAIPCLIDGEEQELRYIDQGNARDPAQMAWRASLGVRVVSPMLESTYQPPHLTLTIPGVANAELKTAWCTPGLMAYSVQLSGQPIIVPVPQTRRDEESVRLREQARRRGIAVGVGGVAVAVAGRALWRHFWRVVIQRFAIRGAIAAALSAADGPLPFGELISLGMALVTAIQIIDDWNEIWREADQVAAEGA